MSVDWLKHAFITKFNHVRASVYERFTDVLAKDVLLAGSLGNTRTQLKGRHVRLKWLHSAQLTQDVAPCPAGPIATCSSTSRLRLHPPGMPRTSCWCASDRDAHDIFASRRRFVPVTGRLGLAGYQVDRRNWYRTQRMGMVSEPRWKAYDSLMLC